MSAGPKSVAPVSVPATARTADIMRCSMNGRAMTNDIFTYSPVSFAVIRSALFLPNMFCSVASSTHAASIASLNAMCTCMSDSSL